MKRIICVVLLFSFTTGLFAQKWLKGIGKVLNTVEKVVDKLPDSKNNQSEQENSISAPATFTYGDAKISTTLPNFAIVVEDVKRIGLTKGAIYLTLISTSAKPVRIYDWQNMTKLVDSKGNSYADYGKWELQIDDCTIRRYGTDGDYVFQANQKVNTVLYITDLNGTATTESEEVGSFVKTTIKVPAITIDNLVLNPSIVYHEENVRRNYTIEISNLKIPAYVHIDRTRVEKDTLVQVKESIVRDTIRIVENIPVRNEEPEKDSSPIFSTVPASSGNVPEEDFPKSPVTKDSLPSSSTNNADKKDDSRDSDSKDKPSEEKLKPIDPDTINITGWRTEVEVLSCTGIQVPSEGPTLDEEQCKALIQNVLNRQVAYVALRRDVHYTNEPTGIVLNLSSAEYQNFDGILFEYVDADLQFKTNKEREIAAQYSSYPRKGTQCGIITSIANEFRKGMKWDTYDGIPTYRFIANELTLHKIEEAEEKIVNGKKMIVFIISVTDTPTPFGIAYSEAIRKANGNAKKSYESEQLLRGLCFEYNPQTKQWKLVIATKYNPETRKWERWITV